MSNTPDRVFGQYHSPGYPKANQWFNIAPTQTDDLFDTAREIANSYDIDSNEGEQLNVIGRVVVQNRNVLQSILLTPTEFTSTSDTDKSEFGDTSKQFSAVTILQDDVAADTYYRKMLKAKIQKNNGDATIDGVIKAVLELEPNNQVKVLNNQDMTFRLQFRDQPDQSTLDLIINADVVPLIPGVEQVLPPLIGF